MHDKWVIGNLEKLSEIRIHLLERALATQNNNLNKRKIRKIFFKTNSMQKTYEYFVRQASKKRLIVRVIKFIKQLLKV